MRVGFANKKVLVLNKGWAAIGVVSLERALIMLFSPCRNDDGTIAKDKNGKEIPKAKIIDPTREFQDFTWSDWSQLKPAPGEEAIRSIDAVFRVPEIIVLQKYNKLPQHKIHFSRRTIYKRDSNQCQYCGCTPGTSELTIDHVLPRSRGGKTTWENCVLACIGCNSKKADKTPEECGYKLRKQPKKPTMHLFKGDIRVKSWEQFLGEAYWLTEIENDNKD